MPSRSKHIPFFISPVTTHADKDNGVLHFRATLLEGFTTRFSAHTLDGFQDITDEVKWEFDESFIGNTGRFKVEDKNFLRGVEKGFSRLKATYRGHPITVDVEILESDMLVYAPDGFVYRIPTEVWTQVPRKKHKHKQHEHHVTRYEPGNLPDSVKIMLDNEVTLANVPNNNTAVIPPSKSGKKSSSDNITCFLLNLNSIMMSYSPKQPLTPLYNTPALRPSPKDPPSKPAANKPRKTAPRRKRG